MFKKVWQGSVQLLRLVGDDSPLGGQVLPSLDLPAMLRFGLPYPAHLLWDVAAAAAAEEHKGSQLHVLEVRLHTSAISSSHPFHDICLSCNCVCKTLLRCIMLSHSCIIAKLRCSAMPASAQNRTQDPAPQFEPLSSMRRSKPLATGKAPRTGACCE